MSYIIDRFEGRIAVLEAENGETVGMERARLPQNSSEGDVLDCTAGIWVIDRERTAARRVEMRKKLESLWDN